MFNFKRLRTWWQDFSASLAFKLSLIYGVSGLMMALFVLAFIYLQIMGALHGHHYRQVNAMAKRINAIYEVRGRVGLVESLRYDSASRSHLTSDLLIMVDAKGEKILGNIDELPPDIIGQDYFPELRVQRGERSVEARLKKVVLDEGDVILIGRELTELSAFRHLIGRTSFLAVVFGIIFTIVSTYWFRYELGASANTIRRTAEAIRAGKFRQRIPVNQDNHELNLLGKELNRMLDYMETSLKGVRHVSDTIAHNLRTPIMRLHAILSPATHPKSTPEEQQQAIQKALDELHRLSNLFDKLLHITEIESGVQRQAWKPISINVILTDLLELYEPLASEQGVTLQLQPPAEPQLAYSAVGFAQHSDELHLLGDPDLLMSALSNLLDNAIKYTKTNVWVSAYEKNEQIVIRIKDDGPGVPEAELELLGTHFYRAAHTADMPGSGLGLASVFAVTRFLRGDINLTNTHPGLEVKLFFPALRENDYSAKKILSKTQNEK